jgi:hypothetical protein
MQVNNFKRLQEENEEIYKKQHEERVKGGILSSLSAFRMVGHVLDMYLPKIFNLFIVAAGGKVSESPLYHPTTTPPSEAIDEPTSEQKPGSPDQNRKIR